MKNIRVLPTNNQYKGSISLRPDGKLSTNVLLGIPQNIYITSDEEIKEGDKDFYIIANDRDKTWINQLEKVEECKIDPEHGKVLILSSGFIYIDEGCKIILTTDPELIADGVQAIDDEFLEWFVKNPNCEEVEVNDWMDTNGNIAFGGNTRYQLCTHLYNKEIIPKEEPKQETLEEAAERLAKIHCDVRINPNTTEFQIQQLIIKGAKWQQERMYSEEDMKQFGLYLGDNLKELKGKTIDEIFEQFKKK